jgi:hypothetical protein
MYLSASASRELAGMGEQTNACGSGWRACSNCAGDYEDPESSARVEDEAFETGEEDEAENKQQGDTGRAGRKGPQELRFDE